MIQQHQYRPRIKQLAPALFCCLFIFAGFKGFAQNEAALNNLQKQFNDYQQQAAQEKLFVHTDKDFFLAGEIIWFKVYAVNAQTSKPSGISKVAYIEVVDGDKKPVLQAKIRLAMGSGNGSFQLPTSVRSGSYTVRAYTNWMKNFSADLYFNKPVSIVNTFKPLDVKQPADTGKYDIQFFPEGGNLVNGIQSKVGFRIVDRYGKGVDCNGTINDQNGQAVASFKPLKFGIGNFTFTPIAGGRYTAVVTVNGKAIQQQLPEVFSQGYTMHVDDGGAQLNVTVASTNAFSPVFLLVNTGQNLKTAAAKQLQNGKIVFTVDKSQLGDGVTHLTLFNEQQQPVCERLYFKRPQQQLLIDVKADQAEYDYRKKINIDINAKDETNVPQMVDMSMAVYRIDSLQGVNDEDILSYLLLDADLKGSIESPGYYFTNTSAEANTALDNVMLTHGWSRFKWEDVQQNKTAFEYLPEYEGHIVVAKITDKKTGMPAENIEAWLSVPGKAFKLAVAKSNARGVVQFNVNDFVGSDELILQTNQQKDSAYRIDIINPFSDRFPTMQAGAFGVTEQTQGLLVQHSINTQVQNAYFGEKSREFYAPDVDTVPFFGQPTKSYLLDDYTRFTTMEEVLREYVSEVAPRKQRGGFVLKVSDDPHNMYMEENPLVLADGVPFFNMDTVIAFNPLKIRKLDVIAQRYYLGSTVLSGIVSYTTYKGDLDGIQLDPSSLVLEYDGMQLQREFYSPKYDNPTAASSRLPDFRDVLYWSPDVRTDDKTGKTQASFYSSDLPGTYAVVVQGITPTGKAASKVVYITVK